MTKARTKITVIGAGSVGVSVAYAALIRGSAAEVALYDIATDKVDAEVLDLAPVSYTHLTLPTICSV